MCSQYGEFWPTSGCDPCGSLGHPCKFQRVRVLAALLQVTLVVGVSQTLRRWTEGTTYIRQGGHHVEHWPTFLVLSFFLLFSFFFFLFSFFPRLISAVGDWMSTILPHIWCGLNANLECMSETCCARLDKNTGRKKIAKKSRSGHHPTTLSGYIFATKTCIDNRKKLLSSNVSSTCPHNMVNFGPVAAETVSFLWGTP